ncbi:SdpI family protein [Clostridium swellfunianum]|uniref:SdpI family protein n=1 Tax=Clostridium swellfunianum TaxID=1367462 RepID=UPI0020303E5D|nr:SdpI family protein [Clostridium swellfunianum]MCM0650166.1 SdpI family protein [Clostridium swellfunianum]
MSILTSCIIGLLFALFGLVLMKYPPEHINNSLGYRTPFAMKNKETWNEGNRFFGKALLICSIVFTSFSILLRYLYSNNLALSMKISSSGVAIIAIGCIIFTEIHLRTIFDRSGIRK